MNLDDLRDKVRENVSALWGRIQESTLFNNLKEQYETWPASVQKTVLISASVLGMLILLSIPYSYIDSASTAIEEYNENRLLIRDLLRVGRAAKDPPPLPPGLSQGDLQAQVQPLLNEFSLTPEQLTPVRPLNERPAAPLAPTVIHQEGVAVQLRKLNLHQILDIGRRMSTLSRGVKITGLEVIANAEDNHYFDVIYKLVSFSLPQATIESEPIKPGQMLEKRPGRGNSPNSGGNSEKGTLDNE